MCHVTENAVKLIYNSNDDSKYIGSTLQVFKKMPAGCPERKKVFLSDGQYFLLAMIDSNKELTKFCTLTLQNYNIVTLYSSKKILNVLEYTINSTNSEPIGNPKNISISEEERKNAISMQSLHHNPILLSTLQNTPNAAMGKTLCLKVVKCKAEPWETGGKSGNRLDVVFSEGKTSIKAVAWNEICDKYCNILVKGRDYLVSNIAITSIDKKYQGKINTIKNFQLTITGYTIISLAKF
jgi:hypothetical protein